MVTQSSQFILRRLILAKQIYHQGARLAQAPYSSRDRILAVIMFDLANETALKAVISSYEPVQDFKDRFHELIQQATNALRPANIDLSNVGHIIDVHKTRNAAQHEGKPPDQSIVTESRIYTRDFLRTLYEAAWGKQFDTISFVDAIEHLEIKNILLDAQIDLAAGDYREAVKKAGTAFYQAIHLVANPLVGRYLSIPTVPRAIVLTEQGRQVDLTSLMFTISRMREVLLCSVLGLDLSQYTSCSMIVGQVIPPGLGQTEFLVRVGREDIGEAESEDVLNFYINAILEMQDRVGDLKKPFGKDEWQHLDRW